MSRCSLDEMLTVTDPSGFPVYLLPWYVRALVSTPEGGTYIHMAGDDDPWEAVEPPEDIARQLVEVRKLARPESIL